MRNLYSFLTRIGHAFLWLIQFFSPKMRLFVKGRVGLFKIISKAIKPDDKTVWFHCASLGEFEQGLPIMEAVRKLLPNYKIVVTFFSPSGYEVKWNTPAADIVTYLPPDTISNAKRFIRAVHPSLAVFVKYEFWPNYLLELENAEIPAILVSGLFRKNQVFFKPHGGFMRKALRTMNYFFVQNSASEVLLNDIDIKNTTVSGDTRFDRVSRQIEQDNTLPYIEAFKKDAICIVCGSTWPEDEAILIPFINAAESNIKFIIAPHTIDASKIEAFRKRITKPTVLFSEKDKMPVSNAAVFIADTVGLLTKMYSYADIAYVGGAMGTNGLHNILEPATFGVPIVIGKNYEKFPEAKRLRSLAALFSVASSEETTEIMQKLISNTNFRNKTGMIAGHFVNSNTGATKIIMDYIEVLHGDGLI